MIKEWENRIIQGDCLELMKQMPDKSVDLVLTDPPYGIKDTWSKTRADRFYHHNGITGYTNDPIGREYFQEIFRVSKNQIIFGGNYYTQFLRPTNSWIIWDKGRDAEKTFMSEAEMAWTSHNKVTRIVRLLWDGAKKCEKVEKEHPHQKPVKLATWCLSKYSEKTHVVLDPFSGSGWTAIACTQLGRSFICFEKEPIYVKLSEKRLERERAQMTLF